MKRYKQILVLITIFAFTFTGPISAWTQTSDPLDPAKVREAAQASGLDSLRTVPVPEPANLHLFLKSGWHARWAAIQLGKALFWDMQVGSDGQACATCHFHAGADSRTKNQLSPGLKNVNVDPELKTKFNPTFSGAAGGPNYTLTELDFPFHVIQFNDPSEPERNFNNRTVVFDTDDVTSSQGVFNADFLGIILGRPFDVGIPFADPIFNVGGKNTRRVEPRNTPTMINAVFNHSNFWDGRAHNIFNGVSVIGPLDENAKIWINRHGELVQEAVQIPDSSLASQAVGPPLSDLEMSFFDRTFPELAKKLFSLRPLGLQLVHPMDSVLGQLSRADHKWGKGWGKNGQATWWDNVKGKKGLNVRYDTLIKKAFNPELWNSKVIVDGYTQMELNFSLFFGLAVQMYEATLVSDKTPFDRFMEGHDNALTQTQMEGLLVFANEGPGRSDLPIFANRGQGSCSRCHGGPELTDASVASVSEEPIEAETAAGLADGLLFITEETVFLDNGFSNIGLRPTDNDLGRGGEAAPGLPFSFVKQNLAGFEFAPELPECGDSAPDLPPCPIDNRAAVDGAFKIPSLRNVELTGPYFHNGGMATLEQVVEFYDRQGDFSDVNVANLDRVMSTISIGEGNEDLVVDFLLSLTDPRVKWEMAPFDHPQIFIPNGHPGDHTLLSCINGNGVQACDDLLEIPAIGAKGRWFAGLPPLGTFLDIEP